MLSCVIYSLINHYVCIDYLCCLSKTSIIIYSDIIFEQTIYNILLDIVITEVLMNLVSCHGFIEKPNATVILNWWYPLVNNYLAKGLFIIENNSKQLSSLPNDVKLIIHGIDHIETDFVMSKNTAISSVENTINKLHIQSNFYFVYKQNFYHDKQDKTDDLFGWYQITLLNDVDHPALIEEWKLNIDAAAYENN